MTTVNPFTVLSEIATMSIEALFILKWVGIATFSATSVLTLIISHLFVFKKSYPSKIFATSVETLIKRLITF